MPLTYTFDELIKDIDNLSLSNYNFQDVLDFTTKYLLTFTGIILFLESIYNVNHLLGIDKYKNKIQRMDLYAPLNSPFQGINIKDEHFFARSFAQLVKGFLSSSLKYMKSTGDEIIDIRKKKKIIINIIVSANDEIIHHSQDYKKHPLVVELGLNNIKIIDIIGNTNSLPITHMDLYPSIPRIKNDRNIGTPGEINYIIISNY